MEKIDYNLPTATQRRPRTFSALVGQKFVSDTLQASTLKGTLAPAYLFSGPRGVGKTTSARLLARIINCVKPNTSEPCGVCQNCRDIANGSCLDVIEIDGASNTSVNDIRQIKDEVLYAPHNCKYKVYIIDEVHMLSTSAFNALLKTIEEPPHYVKFIFATTEVHKVPATIRSRCQQYNFRLIPTQTIVEELQAAAKEKGVISADEEALTWIAKEATGSMRDAYTLFDQVYAFCGDHITLDKIQENLGLMGLDDVNELATILVASNRDEAIKKLSDILANGISVEQFLIDLAQYFRSVLLIKSGVTREALLGYKKERYASEVIEQLSITQIETAIDAIFKLYRDIRFSLSPQFELELLISKLCSITKYFSNKELLGMISGLKKELVQRFSNGQIITNSVATVTASSSQANESNSFAAAQNSTASNLNSQVANSAVPTSSSENFAQSEITDEEKLKKLIAGLKSKQLAILASALENLSSYYFDQNAIVLNFSSRFHSDMIESEKDEISKVAGEIFGRPHVVRVECVQSTAAQPKVEVDSDVDMVKNIFKGQQLEG